MGRVEDGTPYRWGQLYGALVAVRGLARGGRVVPATERETKDAAGAPRGTFEALLPHLGMQILTARQKGGKVAEATAAAVADIGRLVPPERMALGGLGPEKTAAFRLGYAERTAAYRKEWEDIVD
ncbi:hypothetical protein ACFVU3_18995 [Streptomyces sp. NPDC058052]|uniref:hypothetical protein n=1 Tax=Streptomyces sp. NPDC058052 TaxID=3346316 RepID=UPI0036E3B70A